MRGSVIVATVVLHSDSDSDSPLPHLLHLLHRNPTHRLTDLLPHLPPATLPANAQEPFVGRPAIAAYLAKVQSIVPADVRFCVEDITDGDPRRCGVRW